MTAAGKPAAGGRTAGGRKRGGKKAPTAQAARGLAPAKAAAKRKSPGEKKEAAPARRPRGGKTAPAKATAPARRPRRGKTAPAKAVNLALQGGGAHGAFTWGVLDAFLEEERVEIEAISGTSAGAMNAVVLADGMMKGGREGGREALRGFWQAISRAAQASPIRRSPIDVFMGDWTLDNSPGYLMFDFLSRMISPYEMNPMNINPLRDLIAEHVDFDCVRRCDKLKVFVSATNVHTGRVKVFYHHELTPETVMASASLPFIFQAVEIDGVPYWDGGYMGNPALFPFFRACASRDVVIVQINPIERQGTPRTAREILNRVNEITFNASLMREFRAIDFVARLVDDGLLDGERYKRVLVHLITPDHELNELGPSSKLNAEWAFLTHLHELGLAAARDWLAAHYESLGERSSVDLKALFG